MISLIFFYGSLFLSFILALALSPVFSFVLYQSIYFFNPDKRWWGYLVPDLSYSFFAVILIALSSLFSRRLMANSSIFKAPPLLWANLFLLLFGLVYFNAVFPALHYEFFIFFLKLILIMNLAYKLVTTITELKYILYGYVFGAWYISFYIFQVGRNSGNRVEGIGLVDAPDANGLAAALAPAVVLCIYFFWRHKKKLPKMLFAISGVFIANALVLINSRGAFLAVAAGVSFYMFNMFRTTIKEKNQKLVAVFLIIAGLGGGLYLADDSFMERITGISSELDAKEDKETGATRMLFWESAYRMSLDYPLGRGYKSFNYYAPVYIPEWVDTGDSRNRSVHSTWFQVLSEVGYLGLIFFIVMLYSSWKSLKKIKISCSDKKDIDGYYLAVTLQSMLLTYMVVMTFINRMTAEVLFWIIMFSAVAYNLYILKSDENTSLETHKSET